MTKEYEAIEGKHHRINTEKESAVLHLKLFIILGDCKLVYWNRVKYISKVVLHFYLSLQNSDSLKND